MTGPLSDVTVVDFSQFRAGPWCTQIMGELGADVIKVERPGTGAAERFSAPKQGGMSANFIARNRNKRSICLNLKSEEGLEIARELVADADVLVENFSPGTMEGLGLGYEYIHEEVNPGLVYASVKGYGETGPHAGRKGVDLVMQAEAGIMSVTGPEDGEPVKVGQAIGDIGAGLFTTIGIVSALRERDRTGEGQKVSSSIFGTIVSFMEEYLTMFGMTGENPTPRGRRHQTIVPYEVFETEDGELALMVPDRAWGTFAEEVLEAPDLADYDTETRQERYDEVMAVMRPKMRERTTEEWREVLDDYGVPNGPFNRVEDVVDHPQARAQGYVFDYDIPDVGEVVMYGLPMHFSAFQTDVERPPPKLGEHTDEVLAERLGLDEEEIDRLRESSDIA